MASTKTSAARAALNAKDFLKAKPGPAETRKPKKAAGANPERRSLGEATPDGLNSLLDEYTASLEASDETTLLKQQMQEMQRRADQQERRAERAEAAVEKLTAQIAELIQQLRSQQTPALH